jgi:hypothetical protein
MLAAMANLQAPSSLAQEWQALFAQHEQYEKNALWVKLLATVLYALGVAAAQDAILIALVVLVLWLQESMQRTTQARLGARMLLVESLWAHGSADPAQAFQLHTQWLAARKGLAGLLGEYAVNACRPTVAFPYAVFLLHLVAILSTSPAAPA